MGSVEFQQLVKRLGDNIHVQKPMVEDVVHLLKTSKITEAEARKRLLLLDSQARLLDKSRFFEDEWKALADVVADAEDRFKRASKFQFIVAIAELPLFIVVLTLSLLAGWFKGEASGFTAIGIVLVALLSHTFFLLRLHQQAATAMERLVEKRVGILFLRLASNSEGKKVTPGKLIDAGERMFLGHHPKPAEPLGPKDLPSLRAKPNVR